MKKLILGTIIILSMIIYGIQFVDIPSIMDISVKENPKIYAGINDICKTELYEFECQEDLTCIKLKEGEYRCLIVNAPQTKNITG